MSLSLSLTMNKSKSKSKSKNKSTSMSMGMDTMRKIEEETKHQSEGKWKLQPYRQLPSTNLGLE